ncbi:MAG: hypothetical protein K0U59_09505 [Gammaproteobacteria bacterium]|nr:hypothetical protein [Gammaproteobacteria bacterium]
MPRNLLLYCLLLSVNARGEIDTEWHWQAQYHTAWQRFDKNPNNAVLQLPEQTDLVELQSEFLASSGPVELSLQPRWIYDKERVPDTGSNSNGDLNLRYWTLDYYLGDHWFKLGRYVNSWGPARLLSPSNRYHNDTGQKNPNSELLAREYVELGGQLNGEWQYQFTLNTGAGQQQMESFEATGDLLFTWQGKTVSATALVSKPERGFGIGGYGQWTVNEALIVYGDFLYLNQGQKLKRLLPNSAHVAQSSLLAAVTGVSYTLENGWNLVLDYYMNQAGLDRHESRELLAINHDYAAQLLLGEMDATAGNYLTRVNNLPSYQLGRAYVMMMVQRNNIRDDMDINYIFLRNLNDKSGQQTLNLEYRWLDFLTFYGGVNYFSGNENTDFGRFVNWQLFTGLKLYF